MYSKSLDAENKVASKILMEGAAILLFSLLFLHKTFATELDTISNSKFLTYGDTLVSATGVFELGFFQPGSSKNTYLGMWYKKIPARTVVWVANRDRPLLGASSLVLKIVDRGILGLLTNTSMVWSSNTTTSGNTTAKLQDNGNLVVVDQHETVVWQSFDYPTDTLLPGMKIGRDYLRGKEWHLSSWKSGEDPSPGESILDVDTLGYPESKIRQGSLIKSRDAPWTNVRSLPGTSVYNKNLTYRFDVIINENEVSWTCILEDNSILLRATLSSSVLDCWVLVDYARGWQLALSLPGDACDTYNICNAYGTCNTDTIQQSCTCFDEKRFAPKNPKAWETADWSGGCIRRTPLECKNGSEGFVKYSNVKLPYTKNTWYNMSMTLEECAAKCLKNCSCMAYANPDTSRSICLLWFDALLDIRMSMPEGGRDIFVRMASSELDSPSISKNEGGTKIKNILFVLIPGVLLTGLIVATWLCYAQRKRNHAKVTTEGGIMNASKSQEDMERPLFSFTAIANATANFSPDNKLGEGGFGPVYKGMLEEGKEIAVKRLSKHSTQGPDEFKNEVVCISKLQHRNLVKLLGCCIQGDEKLLIYEYMPNKSLDSFIFDKTKSVLLDWTKRFNIIKGIARGLLYLHQDSRLRIIHRDIKTSNILLDEDMNPKISDFGLARCFGGNETQASTERVVGTYGYMSPEYALDGLFSIKSDVFSFGVLVLEIVSGKRNRGFIQPESKNNLFEHVWSLYNEGRPMELIDETCVESCHPPEVVRSIKVGLLCVQQNAEDRPNMSNVILMLGRENELLEPKHPSYFIEKELPVINYTSSSYTGDSMKDFNITEVHAQ